MKTMETLHAPAVRNGRTPINCLFAVLAMGVVASTPVIAGDLEPGRYAIESATHAGKFLRGLPEQGNKVVSAANPQATVFQVVGDQKTDNYTLQSHVFFVSVEGAHDVVMHKAKGAREQFKITKNPDGTFSFKAVWCGKFIAVDKDGNVDTASAIGDGSKFKVYKK